MTSEDVREELSRVAPERECDQLAELSGLFHSAGSLDLRAKGAWGLHLDLGSGAAARRAFRLLREQGIRSEIRTYRRRAFDRSTRFQLHVDGTERALAVLVRAGVLDSRHRPLERPPKRVVSRASSRAAYLRGAFLGGGSLSVHGSPHLELRTASAEAAAVIQELAAAHGITLGIVDRESHAVAYAKSWEGIESLLALAGASQTVLALEERSVVAATRERANRRANADHANLIRTSLASQGELRAVEQLAAEGVLERLPTPLREVAALRTRNPTASVRDLARRTDPPASAAAVHRRLKRLQELADAHSVGRRQGPR